MITVKDYILNSRFTAPCFVQGDSLKVLSTLPNNCIDCVVTSPPYYMKRQYLAGGIGLEATYDEYIENLLAITREIHRVLKPTGSFWLNIGDSYQNKQLLNIPHRVAIRMQDEQNWILRNTVVWDKMKGAMSQSKDSLGCEYEPMFHFVKKKSGYYYDSDAVRRKPRSAHVENGAVVSATGVSGVRYRRKIELSTELTEEQRQDAYRALDNVLNRIKEGELADFRMVIKGANQRVTNLYLKPQPLSPDHPRHNCCFNEDGHLCVKNLSAFWLPEFTLQKEIGGTVYTVTGSYDGVETLDRKMERIMGEKFAEKMEDSE